MIDREHAVSITRQSELVGISRGSVSYQPRPVSSADLALMRRIDELHLEFSFMGARALRDQLVRAGVRVGRKHVSSLMARMELPRCTANPAPARSILGTRYTPICFVDCSLKEAIRRGL